MTSQYSSTAAPRPAVRAGTAAPSAEAVRALQRRVTAFAATGATQATPFTYHR